MRNVILLFVLGMMLAMTAKGQLNLEKVYDYSLTSTKINQTEYKFYLMDVGASQCRIYNADHTLWKTIPVSLPTGYYLFDIKFVTQNLFNSDSNIELWYSAYEWVSTGSSTGYYRYLSKVINESGTVLANITGGVYAYVIQAGTEKYKLAVYTYDNSVTPQTVQTWLYSLPNSTTAAQYISSLLENPFPNPASNYVNIPVNSDATGGLLQVFSVTGQKIIENHIHGGPVSRINTQGWSPGIYSYRLVTGGISSETKQFVIR
jgi:hypothetical protein